MMKIRKRLLYRGDVYLALENERLKVLPNVLTSEYMNGVHDGLKKAQQLITELEDADAGKWEPANSRPRTWQYVCSMCGEVAYYPTPKGGAGCGYRVCPNCGSEMKVWEDDEAD